MPVIEESPDRFKKGGGGFSSNILKNFDGIAVPKYFKAVSVHFSLKAVWRWRSCGSGIPTPISSDLVKLIFRLDSAPYISNSRNRYGSDICGFVSVNIISPAYADTFCCKFPTLTPVTSGFSRT